MPDMLSLLKVSVIPGSILSQNVLLRKRPAYTKSKLERRLIDFPDLIIYCAYKWFCFSKAGCCFRDFPLSLSHFKLECRCSLASKTLSQAQRQSSGPVPTAFHHLLIGPSAAETGLSRLSRLPLRLASLSTPVFGTFNFPFPFFFFFLFWKLRRWYLGSDGRF